jgi:hypothetical protein
LANSQTSIVRQLQELIQFGPFGFFWAATHDLVRAESAPDATLVIDLIDLKRKDAALVPGTKDRG